MTAPPPITAAELIARLHLVPHPAEGGYFRETWRAGEAVESLPARYCGQRDFGTAIYYLLTPDTYSHMHVLGSDEVFHFYLGDAVEQLRLTDDGGAERVVLGADLSAGQQVQAVVPRGVWQGARLVAGGQVALLGCTVAPGFDFADYRHGGRADLLARWGDCLLGGDGAPPLADRTAAALITALTADPGKGA